MQLLGKPTPPGHSAQGQLRSVECGADHEGPLMASTIAFIP